MLLWLSIPCIIISQEWYRRTVIMDADFTGPTLETRQQDATYCVDVLLSSSVETERGYAMPGTHQAMWDELESRIDTFAQLVPGATNEARWSDLRRHLRFRDEWDLRDIIERDWPNVATAYRGPRSAVGDQDRLQQLAISIDNILFRAESTGEHAMSFTDEKDWDALSTAVSALQRELPALSRSPHWLPFRRHLRFGQAIDLRDIVEDDWPNVRRELVSTGPRRLRFVSIGEPVRGGQGKVIQAVDSVSRGLVAVKYLELYGSAESQAVQRRRFRRELRAHQLMVHPCIVPVFDTNIDSDPPSFVMPWCDASLADRFRSGPGLSYEQAINMILGLLHALQHCHDNEVIHRDIKPENILLHNGTWKLSDFGGARDLQSGSTQFTGSNYGTHAYAAPEQLADGHAVNGRADIYAMGKVLYFTLTGGVVPYPNELVDWNLMPAAWLDITRSCMEPIASNRPQSARAVIDAMQGKLR